MRLDPKKLVAGQPTLRIRKLLRAGRDGPWGAEFAAHVLKVPLAQARAIARKLAALGYIERPKDKRLADLWANTVAGNAFANAGATPAIARAKAEQMVQGLLTRAQAVNANPHYLHRVVRIAAFGSFVGDKPTVHDIDLALALEPKEPDPKRHADLMLARGQEAARRGRRFSNFVELLFWGHAEVQRFLKGRCRYLSFHPADEGALLAGPTRMLFQAAGTRRPRRSRSVAKQEQPPPSRRSRRSRGVPF